MTSKEGNDMMKPSKNGDSVRLEDIGYFSDAAAAALRRMDAMNEAAVSRDAKVQRYKDAINCMREDMASLIAKNPYLKHTRDERTRNDAILDCIAILNNYAEGLDNEEV